MGGWRWSAPVERALRLSSPRKEISAAKVSELHESLKEGLINSPQMRDTIALCRGFIHAADVR
ncbi:hypothetical protein XANMN_16400 [Xanthomonas phaseoli pv. manihotis str. CIO151]|nr:hypothetical protein XANMN_16400 [Xanthomonas phaseoli pv. manihotis str. CIO151]